ncbi:MAG: hypothetical protein ABIJ08_05440 [Nanoarchaeota archaeon]
MKNKEYVHIFTTTDYSSAKDILLSGSFTEPTHSAMMCRLLTQPKELSDRSVPIDAFLLTDRYDGLFDLVRRYHDLTHEFPNACIRADVKDLEDIDIHVKDNPLVSALSRLENVAVIESSGLAYESSILEGRWKRRIADATMARASSRDINNAYISEFAPGLYCIGNHEKPHYIFFDNNLWELSSETTDRQKQFVNQQGKTPLTSMLIMGFDTPVYNKESALELAKKHLKPKKKILFGQLKHAQAE